LDSNQAIARQHRAGFAPTPLIEIDARVHQNLASVNFIQVLRAVSPNAYHEVNATETLKGREKQKSIHHASRRDLRQDRCGRKMRTDTDANLACGAKRCIVSDAKQRHLARAGRKGRNSIQATTAMCHPCTQEPRFTCCIWIEHGISPTSG
jgi:hypothetical protein